MLVCFASQTSGCFPLGSLPRLHTFVCLLCWCASPRKLRVCVVLSSRLPSPFAHVCLFVMLVCFGSQTSGLCSAFPFGSLPRLHTFVCLLCWCASPRKHRVCVMLSPRLPSPFAHVCLFVMLVCFASQTSGLCSAFLSAPFPVCTRLFVCYVGVLRLANFGFV